MMELRVPAGTNRPALWRGSSEHRAPRPAHRVNRPCYAWLMNTLMRHSLFFLAMAVMFLVAAGGAHWLLWLALGFLALFYIGMGWFLLSIILNPTRAVRPSPIQRATGRR